MKDNLISEIAREWQPVYQALDREKILQTAIAIQKIPAPTFQESQRASYIQEQFRKLGLHHVERDSVDNVYGWLGGSGPVTIVSAHLDTVFPIDTDLSTYREGNKVYGPGLGDNSLGVAALLLLAEILTQHPVPYTICLVANTCEEGLGNLNGMRTMLDTISPQRIKAVIVIEGIALSRIYHRGIAVRRLKISAQADGGHSWINFGKPSAIHGLVQLANQITLLKIPSQPRTTYNIGLINGGHSVNSIATEAHIYLDLRSVSPTTLEQIEQQVRTFADEHTQTGVQFKFETVGDRPAGAIPPDHPLVQLAQAALSEVGISAVLEQGSTDANVLLARNIPAVVIGITHGGSAHRLDEFIETSSLVDGMWQLILLTIAAARSSAW